MLDLDANIETVCVILFILSDYTSDQQQIRTHDLQMWTYFIYKPELLAIGVTLSTFNLLK